MKMKKWEDIKAKGRSVERLACLDAEVKREAEREVLAMNLRALRESIGKTQEELAALADLSQAELSRFEKREDHLLSTLRRYIAALGGQLEVSAVFGDKRVKLDRI
ncbi:helix-turn-helix domain-containing protein [Sorangium sp. So ce854]|uniref:helix-turn-helix domain-containing protein n=1 Tax=Sorangium sp. So ce854 TaxID=3133322 RepID=UPI003F604481